jgi:hypothetical protein
MVIFTLVVLINLRLLPFSNKVTSRVIFNSDFNKLILVSVTYRFRLIAQTTLVRPRNGRSHFLGHCTFTNAR